MSSQDVLEKTKKYTADFTSVDIDDVKKITMCLLELYDGLLIKAEENPLIKEEGYVDGMLYVLSGFNSTVSKHLNYVTANIQYKNIIGSNDIDKEKIMYFDLKIIESYFMEYGIVGDGYE